MAATVDRSHDARNAAERARLQALVARLDEDALRRPLGEGWTVAVALAHLADWDRGALATLQAWQRTGAWPPFPGAAAINAAQLPTWQAVPIGEAAPQAVAAADEIDAYVRALPDDVTATLQRENPRLLDRSHHRRAHLNEIEPALDASDTGDRRGSRP